MSRRSRPSTPSGSGDALNAAFSLALMEGAPGARARRGVAAGSANALALGAGMLDPLEARRLEDEVSVAVERRPQRLMDRLTGRGIIVTGATGIAGASARLFAAEGARSWSSRAPSHCRDLVDAIAAEGGPAAYVVADLTVPTAARAGRGRRGRPPGPRRRPLQRGRRLRPTPGRRPAAHAHRRGLRRNDRLNATSHVLSRTGPAGDAGAGA